MINPSVSPEHNEARRKNLKTRNIVLGLVLIGLSVLFYIVTLVKGIPLIATRPM